LALTRGDDAVDHGRAADRSASVEARRNEPIKQGQGSAIRVKNMYKELSGGFDVENEGLARFMQGVRAWESAAKLGGAVISSTGDIATQITARRFNGLPAVRCH
jgi:hypothetical protein